MDGLDKQSKIKEERTGFKINKQSLSFTAVMMYCELVSPEMNVIPNWLYKTYFIFERNRTKETRYGGKWMPLNIKSSPFSL